MSSRRHKHAWAHAWLSDIGADSSSCDTRAEGVAALPTEPLPAVGPIAEHETSSPGTGGVPSRPKPRHRVRLEDKYAAAWDARWLALRCPGWTVHLLAEQTLEWRQEIMARQGFDKRARASSASPCDIMWARQTYAACVTRLPYATADVAIMSPMRTQRIRR